MSLHNIDCMKFMKSLDADCMDFTLTDIPYDALNKLNPTAHIKMRDALRTLHKGKADEITFDLNEFCESVNRVTRGGDIDILWV